MHATSMAIAIGSGPTNRKAIRAASRKNDGNTRNRIPKSLHRNSRAVRGGSRNSITGPLRGRSACSIVRPPAGADNSPGMNWQAFRDHFPVTARWAFFDHAAVAPPPADCANVLGEWADDKALNGVTSYHPWAQRVEETRKLAGRLLNTDPLDVCFVGSTTHGKIGRASWRERVCVGGARG